MSKTEDMNAAYIAVPMSGDMNDSTNKPTHTPIPILSRSRCSLIFLAIAVVLMQVMAYAMMSGSPGKHFLETFKVPSGLRTKSSSRKDPFFTAASLNESFSRDSSFGNIGLSGVKLSPPSDSVSSNFPTPSSAKDPSFVDSPMHHLVATYQDIITTKRPEVLLEKEEEYTTTRGEFNWGDDIYFELCGDDYFLHDP